MRKVEKVNVDYLHARPILAFISLNAVLNTFNEYFWNSGDCLYTNEGGELASILFSKNILSNKAWALQVESRFHILWLVILI